MAHEFKTLRLDRVTRRFGGVANAGGAAELAALGKRTAKAIPGSAYVRDGDTMLVGGTT